MSKKDLLVPVQRRSVHRFHALAEAHGGYDFNGRAQTGARFFNALLGAGLKQFRIELLDEDKATALRSIQTYRQFVGGEINQDQLMQEVEALEKLGVTEGTLLEP